MFYPFSHLMIWICLLQKKSIYFIYLGIDISVHIFWSLIFGWEEVIIKKDWWEIAQRLFKEELTAADSADICKPVISTTFTNQYYLYKHICTRYSVYSCSNVSCYHFCFTFAFYSINGCKIILQYKIVTHLQNVYRYQMSCITWINLKRLEFHIFHTAHLLYYFTSFIMVS